VGISDALRTFALGDVPFGIWQAKDGCDLGSMPKVSDFSGAARPRWMDVQAPAADAPVYTISPSAEIFTQICSNCHGPQADSKGRLAATIADMTGGQTRVANLRDGIFGPVEDPGANRERIFGPVAQSAGDTAEVWAARYLMFMGLGGTQRTIPTPALQTIRNGAILGEKRPDASSLDVSTANMLSVPLALCRAVIPGAISSFVPAHGQLDFAPEALYKTPLIEKNGDLEMWQQLCALDNDPMPVRVVIVGTKPGDYEVSPCPRDQDTCRNGLRHAAAYPADAPVGDQHGRVQMGIQPGNTAPWCLQKAFDQATADRVSQEWQAQGGTGQPPYCPDAFLGTDDAPANVFNDKDVERWATRGAMNAGMSVFLYLDALAKGKKAHPTPFDHCEQLQSK
jgi:mono/diheme cytochrome c family protein